MGERLRAAAFRWAPWLAAAGLVVGCRQSTPPPAPAQESLFVRVSHGVMAGDVTETTALVWARAERHAQLRVVATGAGQQQEARAWATSEHDFTATVSFEGLHPDTDYEYRAWFSADGRGAFPPPELTRTGHFKTAPPPTSNAEVTFGWSGDLGGINVCRDTQLGYPIFKTMRGRDLDFFIGLGDMIYGDQACEAVGFYGNPQIPAPVREATTIREYWAHWKYNREDEGLRELLASTAYVAMWDDHEVVNDFGPSDAWHAFPPYATGANLLPLGRHAFFDYSAVRRDQKDPNRLYRAFRHGRHLDLILTDTRSYRDPNTAPDTPERPKTMFGVEQRRWLVDRVTHSDATWKVVVASVPISIPTGRGGDAGHDGFCRCDLETGYEQELAGIFRAFRDAGVMNLVFLTTDVHFATGFRYHPLPETKGFVVYEFTTGPLGAMVLGSHTMGETFHPERLFYFGAETTPKTFEEAQPFMNWGKITISNRGHLELGIEDGVGREAVTFAIDPHGGPGRTVSPRPEP